MSSGRAFCRWNSSISSWSSATTSDMSFLMNDELRTSMTPPTIELGIIRTSTAPLGPRASVRNAESSAPPVAPMKKM